MTKGIITIDKLIELMYVNPRRRFGFDTAAIREELAKEKPTFAIWALDEEYHINPEEFYTKGRSCPFEGWHVKGRCLATVINGKLVWKR